VKNGDAEVWRVAVLFVIKLPPKLEFSFKELAIQTFS
jgi:hypothetical protein